MKPSLCHLHVHSCYSLLESYVKIEQLVKQTKEYKMTSVAITDKNNMFAMVKFYNEAKKNGIKPIIASQLDIKDSNTNNLSKIALYVKNKTGYKNLSFLVSLAYQNNEFKPYIELDELYQNNDGLIAVIGLEGSNLNRYIDLNMTREYKNLIMKYIAIFSHDNLYLALSSGLTAKEDNLIAKKLAVSSFSGLSLIAFNEVYYIKKSESVYQDILFCIKNGAVLTNPNRKRLPSNNYYFRSQEEMINNFKFCPSALENTIKLSEKCNFNFEFGSYHMPKVNNLVNKNAREVLKKNSYKGLKSRYGIDNENIDFKNDLDQKTKVILERIEYELSVISSMGFDDYFLICQDYVNYAKSVGIEVGPGRGSGSGSLVCYLLGITDIDPIEYSLLFERFLNPERIDMPDLDIDFQEDRKFEVIDYVSQKYGAEKVAQIITFGTLSAKSVIKDVGRVLGFNPERLNYITSLVKNNLNYSLQNESKFKEFYLKNNQNKSLVNYALALEGLPRHSSIHAAGLVISDNKITDLVPLIVKSKVCTQYDMDDIKKLGLVKMDFLSLKKLSIISDILSVLKNNPKFDFSKYQQKFDDKKTYKMLASGKNTGIFQLESTGMMEFFKKLKPKNLEDIIIGISIFRPGPSAYIPNLLSNREYPNNIKYEHPLLEPILKKTYGCLVYQEQVIEIARVVAGFSYARADKIRRAMSKKNIEIMEEEKKNFIYGNLELGIKGAISNGLSENLAKKIYDRISNFASYAFNKSHAAAYATVAYKMAYLKANYPVEFMTSLLSSEIHSNDKTKLHKYLRECFSMKIKILPPSVKFSRGKFTIENKGIRYGLYALKYLGLNTVKKIERLQESNQGFPSKLEDFYKKMPRESLNKKSIESLAISGALDCYNINKASIILNFDNMQSELSSNKFSKDNAQISLMEFANLDDNITSYNYKLVAEYDDDYLAKKMIQISGLNYNFFKKEIQSNRLYIRLNKLNNNDKIYIESLPKSSSGYQLMVYEEKFDRIRQFKEKINLDYDLLSKLKIKYGNDNVKVDKV